MNRIYRVSIVFVLILPALTLFCNNSKILAQAKKPILMVVPSDVWCFENGYMMEYENLGVTERVPDYEKALQQNSDLLLVITKINDLMNERGFPLKDLESSLRSLNILRAEDNVRRSQTGAGFSESPIDMLKRVAQADIWVQVTWTINQKGPKRSVTYILRALDAYTDKQIASANGTGEESFAVELPVLLEEAIVSEMNDFTEDLDMHFGDMEKYGREVTLRIKNWDSWDKDLNAYLGDYQVNEVIEVWIYENAVDGKFSTTIATANQMMIEQIRIPLYDERERPLDTRNWARGLQRYLRINYDIQADLMMRGLGQAQLVLGSQ